VVNETSLGELHEILQNAFDWSGEHLHRFFALLPFWGHRRIYSETYVKGSGMIPA
jgi:hypothetical protein